MKFLWLLMPSSKRHDNHKHPSALLQIFVQSRDVLSDFGGWRDRWCKPCWQKRDDKWPRSDQTRCGGRLANPVSVVVPMRGGRGCKLLGVGPHVPLAVGGWSDHG